MTTAKIKQTDNIVRVSIEGHAGDPRACAACSVLGQTLQQCLRDLANGGLVDVYNDAMDDEAGSLYIKARVKRGSKESVGMMLGVIATGFMLLEEQYPDHVKLIYRQ